jgi:hypothetical protein
VVRRIRALGASIAQSVDEDVDQPQHALLPARLIVRVAHAARGSDQIIRADVVTVFTCRHCPVQPPKDRRI